MSDVRPTIRRLAEEDPRGAVWCACLCAGTVRHLMPDEALTALRLAWLWSQGVEVSPKRLEIASADAHAAADAVTFATSADATASAAHAVAGAVDAAADADADASADYVTGAAASAADASASAYAAHAGAVDAAADADAVWQEAKDSHLRAMGELVAHQLTPLPIPESPLGDWLLEHGKTGRVGTLGESLAWAREQRLRWWVLPERLLAEHRVVDPTARQLARLRGVADAP